MGKFDAERLQPVTGAQRIKVTFNAATSEALPWSFVPQQKHVYVLPGETSLAFYTAKNNAPYDVIGIATYNVLPDRVGRPDRWALRFLIMITGGPLLLKGRVFLL